MHKLKKRKYGLDQCNDMPPEVKQTLKDLFHRFRRRFGRDPGPNDPIFFDPQSNQPAPLGREALNGTWERMADAMVQYGEITPEVGYAMKKTGFLVTERTKDLLCSADLCEWNDALEEYRNFGAATR